MTKNSFLGLIAATATCLTTTGALAAEWQLAEGMGSVQFTAVQQGTKFTGRFQSFAATINIDPAAIEKGSIVGTVETASVNTRDHDRDSALTDGDWFDSTKYPEARFESSSIVKTGEGYRAEGTLTIKGTSKPAAMDFTFDAAGMTAKFMGKLKVNRFDFNVGEGWNDTSWVGQDVDVQINLDLKH
jgi:polyisoprenoid-binding protein YceI